MCDDFFEKFKHKERSIEDLALYMKNTVEVSEVLYCILLGAGASVSSGIRTGQDLVHEWRNHFLNKYCPDESFANEFEKIKRLKDIFNWYKVENEYSSLFGKLYDLPFQRKNFIEKEVAKAEEPSIGYRYLNLLASEGIIDTFFTTNFDDLLEKSIYSFKEMKRPIVCAHDSSVANISITSQRTKIIKLHGDFLFSTLQSTTDETTDLKENMKLKFEEFLRNYGLIVAGYAGNDESVMNVLNTLVKGDYVNNGIYWCIKKQDWENQKISEYLKNLIKQEKVYYILIENFDDFCAKLTHSILGLKAVSLDLKPKEENIKKIDYYKAQMKKFRDNNLIQADIKEHLAQYDTESQNLQEISQFANDKKTDINTKPSDYGGFEKDRLITPEERDIKNLIDLKQYKEAMSLINNSLIKKDLPIQLRILFLALQVTCYLKLKDNKKAIFAIDEIIEINYKNKKESNVQHLLKKAEIIDNPKQKIEVLEEALQLDPYDPYLITKLANEKGNQIFTYNDTQIKTVLDLFDKAIQLDPTPTNDAYFDKLTFITKHKKNPSEIINVCEQIEKDISTKDPLSYLYYESQIEKNYQLYKDDKISKEEVLEQLNKIFDLFMKNNKIYERNLSYIRGYIDKASELIARKELLVLFKKYDNEYKEDVLYTVSKSLCLLSIFRNLDDATALLEQIDDKYLWISKRRRFSYFSLYLKYLLYKEEYRKIFDIVNSEPDSNSLKSLSAYIEALFYVDKELYYDMVIEKFGALKTTNDYMSYTYHLLKLEEYDEIYKICNELFNDVEKAQIIDINNSVLRVNYSLAKQKQNRTVNKTNLENILENKEDSIEKAAAYILIGDNSKAESIIKKEIEEDYGTFYEFKRMPIFKDIDFEKITKSIEPIDNLSLK